MPESPKCLSFSPFLGLEPVRKFSQIRSTGPMVTVLFVIPGAVLNVQVHSVNSNPSGSIPIRTGFWAGYTESGYPV